MTLIYACVVWVPGAATMADGLTLHLLLPRIAYVACLIGLLVLAVHYVLSVTCMGSFSQKRGAVDDDGVEADLPPSSSALVMVLLGVLDCVVLGPAAPPALLALASQGWLLLQLLRALRRLPLDHLGDGMAALDDHTLVRVPSPKAALLTDTRWSEWSQCDHRL
eukprot:COSAG01_NODE_1763_length_9284_cov_67.515079_2_plen_164_part_00